MIDTLSYIQTVLLIMWCFIATVRLIKAREEIAELKRGQLKYKAELNTPTKDDFDDEIYKGIGGGDR